MQTGRTDFLNFFFVFKTRRDVCILFEGNIREYSIDYIQCNKLFNFFFATTVVEKVAGVSTYFVFWTNNYTYFSVESQSEENKYISSLVSTRVASFRNNLNLSTRSKIREVALIKNAKRKRAWHSQKG